MPEPDMATPASVSWSEGPLDGEMADGTGGFTRHFDTLAAAALFAATELPECFRGNAWIATESHTFQPSELAVLAAKATAEGYRR